MPDVGPAELAALASALHGPLVTAPRDVAPFLRDASRARPDGLPVAAVLAADAHDVQAAVLWAGEHGVPVSVRGSGTGLSGGAVAYAGGLVVSTAGMDRILRVDPGARLAVVEPGVVVADLDRAARKLGLFYAPDPVSAETCTVGGTVATNAGGLRCVAHGVTREAVAGLEVVLGDGRRVRLGGATRKNVTGYDLLGLVVGSEGTLGIVTEVTVRLRPLPAGEPVAFRAEFEQVGQACTAVESIMASPWTPELLELLDGASLELVERHFPGTVGAGAGAALVGQLCGPGAAVAARDLVALCQSSGAVRVDVGDSEALLAGRRRINPALSAEALAASCDVAVPLDRLAAMFEAVADISDRSGVRVATFAHAGDGNLHPAVVLEDDSAESWARCDEVLDAITRTAVGLGGVVSGEHGIGSLKLHLAREQLDPVVQDLQAAVRAAFDPKGVLTPGRGT